MSSDIKAPWVYSPVQQRDGNRAFKNTLEQKKYPRKIRLSKEQATDFLSPPSSQVKRKRESMEIEKASSPDESKSLKIEEEEEEEVRSSYSPNKSTEIVNEDLEFMQASSVNVFNFVSVKLSGKSNYIIWKAQMICLLKNQKMHGAIVEDQTEKYWSDKIHKQYDDLFKGWICASLNEKVFDRVKAYDSGSIVWKELKSLYDPISSAPKNADGPDPGRDKKSSVEVVVPKHNNNTELQVKLRYVTLEGRWWKAKSILKRHKDAATTEAISDHGDTMLHLAVREGKNYLVEKLLNFIHDGTQVENKNTDGQTALHIAAIVGNKDAAKLLVTKRIELLNNPDTDLNLPFASAYFNGQVSTFEYLWEATKNAPGYCFPENAPKHRSPDDLIIDKNENPIDLLSIFIYEKKYYFAKKLLTIRPNLATEYPSPLTALTENFPSDITFVEELIKPPSLKNVRDYIVKRGRSLFYSPEYLLAKAEDSLWAMRWFRNRYYSRLLPEIVMIILAPVGVLYPLYQLMRLLILLLLYPFLVLYFLLWKVFAIVAGPIKRIEKKKKEYEEAKEVLKLICDHFNSKGWDMPCSAPGFYNGVFYHKYYSIPILTAVSLDVPEVVDQILCYSSDAIDVKNMEGHNIIQLSIVNRSEKVYNLIRPKIQSSKFDRDLPDSSGNNLLHLVGRLAPSVRLSHTTGAALQLQRELQWREEVEKLMGSSQLTDQNVDNETPDVVFTREHTDLVQKGEQWMKTTAESCSITAALIVTIVFAAAITVPGGSNQETGIPLFKKDIAFRIFALSDAISLFTAATSLLVYLSILTTRFAEKDFLRSLPRRLLIALCLLFLSTIAMLLAFCAILFLVFCDHRPWMLAPIGALACLPIAAIVMLQLPLVVDLYRSTYSPLFGM